MKTRIEKLPKLQRIVPQLPQNIMTIIFHLHASQTLYQSTDFTYQQLRDLEAIFPTSHFLRSQRALLLYHSKGKSTQIVGQASLNHC